MTDTIIGLWGCCMIGRDMSRKKPTMVSGNALVTLVDA